MESNASALEMEFNALALEMEFNALALEMESNALALEPEKMLKLKRWTPEKKTNQATDKSALWILNKG